MTVSDDDRSNFTISEDLIRPLLAAVIGVETIAALLANSFVLIFTLCNIKTLKQPSIIFLTNLVLGNLFIVVLYMIPVFITSAVGEWIFGTSIEMKDASCQFVGYSYSQNVFLTTLTFTVISVDRFLFIVKPFIHKRYMKTWVATVIIICAWIFSGLMSLIPFAAKVHSYEFNEYTGICGSPWIGHIDHEFVFIIVVLVSIVIIMVTTMWTFCFTRKFIRHLQNVSSMSETRDDSHVYNHRIRKLVGIFGALLIATTLTHTPGFVVAIISIAIDAENVPGVVYTAVHLIYYLSYILIPLIQLYFRKELKHYLMSCFRRIIPLFCTTKTKSDQQESHLDEIQLTLCKTL